jgi:hypothetical protein
VVEGGQAVSKGVEWEVERVKTDGFVQRSAQVRGRAGDREGRRQGGRAIGGEGGRSGGREGGREGEREGGKRVGARRVGNCVGEEFGSLCCAYLLSLLIPYFFLFHYIIDLCFFVFFFGLGLG